MKINYDNIDELLAKYFAGEASDDEKVFIKNWKAQSDQNAEEFEIAAVIFSSNKMAQTSSQNFDAAQAWKNVSDKLKLKQSEIPASNIITMKPRNSMWWRIAAAFIVLIGGSYAMFRLFYDEPQMITMQSFDSAFTDTLPDGSTYTLNKKTTVSYANSTYKSKRTLQLKGEAFFDVVHNNDAPFVIEANGLMIEDIGTSFNVKAYPDSEFVTISVLSGEVKIYNERIQQTTLKAGEEIRYSTSKEAVSPITEPTPNISAYKDKLVIFDNTTLQNAADVLNSLYDEKIKIENDALKNCVINATFHNEKIEDIVNVITETLNIKSKTENNTIIIYGASCK